MKVLKDNEQDRVVAFLKALETHIPGALWDDYLAIVETVSPQRKRRNKVPDGGTILLTQVA